jgi:hypothetical protein
VKSKDFFLGYLATVAMILGGLDVQRLARDLNIGNDLIIIPVQTTKRL